MSNERIEEMLENVLADDDCELAEQIVNDNEDDYEGDIYEAAFRIAVQQNCYEYVRIHRGDVDLNDVGCGESSSYLNETDNKNIIDLLISAGACRSWDDYQDYKFAVETVNGSVLAFDPDFQEEVFNKLLEKLSLSEKQVAEMLDNGEAEEFELPDELTCMDVNNLQEACDTLLATSDGEEITLDEFDFMDDSVKEWNLRGLVENLGWKCSFEGDSWKFETNGVYFIE